MDNDIYRKILNLAKRENPAGCWFNYPPTFLLSKEIKFSLIKKSLKDLINSKDQVGLYVNIPFCKTKCRFCMYYSEISTDEKKIDDYLSALEKEIKLYGLNFKKKIFEHLYIGGGTPLLLNERQLQKLFDIIFNNFKFSQDSQFIIEARPEDYTPSKLRVLIKNRINRATVGIQTFNEKTLKGIARPNRVKDFYTAFKNIRRAGINCINVDILVGLPGESKKDYKNTIRHLLALKPECISCYILISGGRVALKRKELQSKQRVWEGFRFFERELGKHGYSCEDQRSGTFLLKGNKEANNKLLFGHMKYESSVLGIGSRALSYLPRVYYCIENSLDRYIRYLKKEKQPPVFIGMPLDKDDAMRQYIILRLYFFNKLDPLKFKEKFKKDLFRVFKKEMKNLEKAKAIMISDKIQPIYLTKKNLDQEVFLYNILKYFYRKDCIKKIIEKYL